MGREKVSPVRIILLASGDLWGGAERVIYNLSREINDRDDTMLLLLALNEGRLTELCRESGVPTRLIDESKCDFSRLALRTRKTSFEFGADIIHSHGYKENVLAYLSALGSSSKLIATIHGLAENSRKLKTKVARQIDFMILRSSFDKVVAVSEDIRRALTKSKAIPAHKVETIHNGICLSRDEKPRNGNQRGFWIGSAGRLFAVKDFSLMVQIARKLCAKRQDIHFLLAGDGPERERLSVAIQSYELQDRFKLLGHLKDMTSFYSQIDLFLNTSFHEGIPMAVLEAMSYNLPVVAPNVGGLPEIVKDGQVGYLVSSREPSEFVSAIEMAIANKLLLGANSRRRIEERFTTARMCEGYMRLYKQIFVS